MAKENFLINGGRVLTGEVEISGSKNSALPLISAGLLTSTPSIIKNIPLVSDVLDLITIAKEVGAEIDFLDQKTIRVYGKEANVDKIPVEIFEKIRASILLLPFFLQKNKKIKIPQPGGDRIGLRPIATHLEFLNQLGIKTIKQNQFYFINQPKEVKETNIVLNEFSVTTSEIALSLLATIEKKFHLSVVATEPHVQDLCFFLQKAGAKIKGIGSNFIEIQGSKKLKGVEFTIPPDPIETGTFLIAFALTNGQGEIKNVRINDLGYFLKKMKEIGVIFEAKKNKVIVHKSKNFKGTKIQSMPFPGFPTDLQPQTSVLLAISKGRSLVHEPLYENRFSHLHQLKKMGADIEVTDPHRAIIFGKTKLLGEKLDGSDIRSTASLVLAGLTARGQSLVSGIEQLRRGYEQFEEKLKKLGADIKII